MRSGDAQFEVKHMFWFRSGEMLGSVDDSDLDEVSMDGMDGRREFAEFLSCGLRLRESFRLVGLFRC